jgi:hypothetical protein
MVLKNHYMKTFPSGAKVFFGVLHEGISGAVGVAVFGSSSGTLSKIKLFKGMVKENEIIEMQRLWISDLMGQNAESKVLALLMKAFKEKAPQLKVVWTYAGGCKNDCGIVYQSSGFCFVGSEPCDDFYLTEKGEYKNIINALRFGKGQKGENKDQIALRLYGPGAFIKSQRHYYFYPLEKKIRRKMQDQLKPFPKYSANYRKNQVWITNGAGQGDSIGSNVNALSSNLGGSTNCASRIESGTSSFQGEGGGESPTDALHLTNNETTS